jgi:hypothetical protein
MTNFGKNRRKGASDPQKNVCESEAEAKKKEKKDFLAFFRFWQVDSQFCLSQWALRPPCTLLGSYCRN